MRIPRTAIALLLGLVPACGGGDGDSADGGSGDGLALGWFSHHTIARYDDVPLINGGHANTVCSAVVDENDDGIPDLVGVVGLSPVTEGGLATYTYYLPHVVTRFGAGGGLFTASWGVLGDAPYTYDHRWGVAGDFDEDGLLDLAVTDAIDEGVRAILNLELSGYRFWIPQAPTSVGGVPSRVVAGDWDEDGHVDVAVLVPGAQRVRVLFGDGEGVFTQRTFPDELPLATGAIRATSRRPTWTETATSTS